LLGSDFPTPASELYADAAEVELNFKAVMEGHFERVIVPQDNLLDVNHRLLHQAFLGHPLFTVAFQSIPYRWRVENRR
jgi:hypothetical protein